MIKQFLARFGRPAAPRRPVKIAALKAFCVVRHAQRSVVRIPAKAQAVIRDVSDAWRESGRIVPNE
jgi:hypothetical protein